jgi:triacylglycerol esterase/lipase EstA (alpha/beta hydrolase family)
MNKERLLVVVGGFTLFLLVTNVSTILFCLLPVAAQGQSEKPLPVLLIHGYRSTNKVWNEWVDRLKNLGIETEAVSFEDNPATAINEDKCGSVEDHPAKLNQKITDFKAETGREKINIVTRRQKRAFLLSGSSGLPTKKGKKYSRCSIIFGK